MAIKAVYTQELPNGEVLFGLTPEDHEKIRNGYGCPKCLEDFTEYGANGIVVAFGACPLCKHTLSDRDLMDVPQHWLPDPTDDRS